MVRRHLNPGVQTERSFGRSVGAASIIVAGLAWWRGYAGAAAVLAGTGAILIVCAYLAPAVLRVPNRIWRHFAHLLGTINARVMLTALFVAVITPMGIIMRMAGRNPLRSLSSRTSWSEYGMRPRDPRHYERMF